MIQVHGLMSAKELRYTTGDKVMRELDPQFVWQGDVVDEHFVHLSLFPLYNWEDLADHSEA